MKEAQHFGNTMPEAMTDAHEQERSDIVKELGLDPNTATLRDVMVVRAGQNDQAESDKR